MPGRATGTSISSGFAVSQVIAGPAGSLTFGRLAALRRLLRRLPAAILTSAPVPEGGA